MFYSRSHYHENNQLSLRFEDWYTSDITEEEVAHLWHMHPELYHDELMSITLNKFFKNLKGGKKQNE